MDKTWIHIKNRVDPAYLTGVANFIEFAYVNKDHQSKIYCPCKQCANLCYETRNVVLEHLVENGFLNQYERWTLHGESPFDVVETQNSNRPDNMVDLVHDVFGPRNFVGDQSENIGQENIDCEPDEETNKFFKHLADAERELYPGCDSFTTLSFMVQLMRIKVLNGWSDKSFDMLVELLKKAFPKGETLPKSYYEAKKFNEALGFTYKKIDACPIDCMLYWKDKENLDKCDYCHRSRFKIRKGNSDNEPPIITNVPAKQVRYFPIKPRLQKLFMSPKTASLMSLHAKERTKDGKLRHPADSLAWKDFDEKHHDFGIESRNIRLGLASDGFSPFKSMTNPHSTWPVVLMPYNLPPWLCMKQPFFMLSLLIDGPRSSGNDIDVKDNCEVLDTYRDNCLKSVGDKWRKWKWRIKQDYYSKFDNDEERLANVPPRVDAEQWKLFVQYQGTEMAMERSETNRENQNQRVMAHTSGRKSHQVVREELIKAGKRGDRLDVYVTTHTNKKEKPVDQEAAKALDVIDKKLKEKSESEQTLEFREKIFIDVFGPDTHGRVRSFGKGPSPTQVFGKRNNQSPEQYAQDLERMREMRRKEGREEGFKEGLKEGRIEGREEGREEWRKDLDRVEINNTDKTIDKSPAENYMETSDAESSHQLSTDSSVSLYKVGTKVHLLSARLPKKVVAKGIVISIDPETKLNGFSIGDGYWVVRITEDLLPHENLLIAQGNIRKVGHAVKHKVVWRKVDVKRN